MAQPLPADAADRDALAFLFDRINYERADAMPYGGGELHLDRMRELLNRLGNPERALRVVHVAGTKGKGSTAAMIQSILTASGLACGLYTSPHLERIEERLAIDGRPCTAGQFTELIADVRPVVREMDARAAAKGEPGPTFFELTTALAMLHFVRQSVDAAVLEVGLGGRLDSTNVCHPVLGVITSISLDHTRQLGNSLTSIAREKAGIVKKGVPMVSGVTDPRPRAVIREVAGRQQAPLLELGRDFHIDKHAAATSVSEPRGTFTYRDADGTLADLPQPLWGAHQVTNAALAVAAVRHLDRSVWPVDDRAVARGLAEVRLPARVEIVVRRPLVILDTAHNVASIEALLQFVDRLVVPGRRTMIFAASREKDAGGMLSRALPRFDRLLLTRYTSNPRAHTEQELAETARALAAALPGAAEIATFEDPQAAWHACAGSLEDDDLVCVAGSFFLAAELRPQLARVPNRPTPLSPLGS